jgi:hypothetical protein
MRPRHLAICLLSCGDGVNTEQRLLVTGGGIPPFHKGSAQRVLVLNGNGHTGQRPGLGDQLVRIACSCGDGDVQS